MLLKAKCTQETLRLALRLQGRFSFQIIHAYMPLKVRVLTARLQAKEVLCTAFPSLIRMARLRQNDVLRRVALWVLSNQRVH